MSDQGTLGAECISRHFNRFISSLTPDLVFLSVAEMSGNSLVNLQCQGGLIAQRHEKVFGSSMTKGLKRM